MKPLLLAAVILLTTTFTFAQNKAQFIENKGQAGSNTFHLNTSSLANGKYILKLTDDNSTQWGNVVVQK